MAGEETVIPQAAQRLAEFGASITAVAVGLNEAHQKAIEQKLTECANKARETVLRQHMQGRSPTPAECRETKNFGGRVSTDTRQRELISPEKEEALLEEGCYSELRVAR